MPKFEGKISVRAMIQSIAKNMILVVKDYNYDLWEIMGGRLEVGETVKQALTREAKEELGMNLNVGDLIYDEQFNQSSDNSPHLMLVFLCTFNGPLILNSSEIELAHWIRKEDLFRYHFFDNCNRVIKHYFGMKC